MTRDQLRVSAAVAAVAVVAGGAGFALSRLTQAPAEVQPVGRPPSAEPEAARPAAVAMTPQAVGAAEIAVAPADLGSLEAEILAQGGVVARPDGQAVVTARAAGAVIRLSRRLGDPVRAGEPLAVVESRDAAQITADRSAAAARADLARRTLAREKSLFEQRVSPRVDYEQAQAQFAVATAELRRAQSAAGAARVTADGRGVVVSSPVSGRITAAPATLGAFVQPETELFRVSDPTRVQVEAAVPGAEALRLRPGDAAAIELSDGTVVAGRVRAITPALDGTTRSATAVIDPQGGTLIAGAMVRVRLSPGLAGAARTVVVPEAAVQTLGGREVVFVRTTAGFRAAEVAVGRRSGGRVEITRGLRAGQLIATRNAFLLKAELGKAEGEED